MVYDALSVDKADTAADADAGTTTYKESQQKMQSINLFMILFLGVFYLSSSL